MTLEQAIFFGGVIHMGILTAGIAMTRVLEWKTELKKINQLSAHVIWTHGAYVWFTILAFGLISLLWPGQLINGGPVANFIAAFIAFFWGVRLIIQLFFFDAHPYLTDFKLKLGYHGLTACFGYFTLVYGLAAARGFQL